ncbi:hypothetical protein Ccrd_018316, partial [Cynara cardunculus var. scolymus]
MFNLATKLARRPRGFSHSPPVVRLFSTQLHDQFKPNPVALQMIDYAISLSRSQKSVCVDESYGQGLLVLEQCESNQHDANSKGLVLLAMSTILSERGNLVEAIEKLNTIKDLKVSSFPLRVAATEALAGLHLESGEDDTSSVIADVCLNDLDATQSCFKGVEDNLGVGNGVLSYAEFLHATRDFATAKQLYQNVIQGIPENKDYSDPYKLAAGPHHPKIGIILTCIALMFRHKAKLERSSSLMVQEVDNLFPLDVAVEQAKVYRKDIIALAR